MNMDWRRPYPDPHQRALPDFVPRIAIEDAAVIARGGGAVGGGGGTPVQRYVEPHQRSEGRGFNINRTGYNLSNDNSKTRGIDNESFRDNTYQNIRDYDGDKGDIYRNIPDMFIGDASVRMKQPVTTTTTTDVDDKNLDVFCSTPGDHEYANADLWSPGGKTRHAPPFRQFAKPQRMSAIERWFYKIDYVIQDTRMDAADAGSRDAAPFRSFCAAATSSTARSSSPDVVFVRLDIASVVFVTMALFVVIFAAALALFLAFAPAEFFASHFAPTLRLTSSILSILFL